jgi:hypothetical protein
LQELIEFYAEELVEDPIDGTDFDCAVFDFLDKLKATFCEPNVISGEYPDSIVLAKYVDRNGGIDRT